MIHAIPALAGNNNCRRTAIAALSGVLLVLTACGPRNDSQSAAGDAAQSPTVLASSGDQKVVHVYNWADYIEPAMLEKFTAETGIEVNYDTYDSNEVLETKLLAGKTGYDVVVPSNTYLERQIRAGAPKLDRSKIPNWSNLDPIITERVAPERPRQSVRRELHVGYNGIGYNKSQVRAIMPDAPVNSWKLVFEPEFASKFKDCGISMLDSPADIVPLVLIYWARIPTANRRRICCWSRRNSWPYVPTYGRSAVPRFSNPWQTVSFAFQWPGTAPCCRRGTARWRPGGAMSSSTTSQGGHNLLVRHARHPEGCTTPGKRPRRSSTSCSAPTWRQPILISSSTRTATLRRAS